METLEAAKYLKERKVPLVSVIGKENSPRTIHYGWR